MAEANSIVAFQPGDTVCNVNPASIHYGTTGLFQRTHDKWTFAAGLACDVKVKGGYGPYGCEDVLMSVSDLKLLHCSDCAKGYPFAKTGKAYEQDTRLYECDNRDCSNYVCRRHLQSLYTLGDFCGECAECEKEARAS